MKYMSYALGVRIKELRTKRDITQERMADILGTTRQRYSRLENGQIDISFVTIKKLADVLGVTTAEITSAIEEKKELVTLFREKSNDEGAIASVVKIQQILQVFQAHEKLYYQMRERDRLAD